jgi:DNA-binding transcriptional regulator YiaG
MKKKLTRKGYTHVTKVGRYRVTDATAMMRHDAQGNAILSHDELVGYERRAARVVLQDVKSVDGVILKFARKALELRQVDLAVLLGYRPEQICRYETNAEPIPRAVQLAVAELLCIVEMHGHEILAYLQDADRDEPSQLEVQPLRKAL